MKFLFFEENKSKKCDQANYTYRKVFIRNGFIGKEKKQETTICEKSM